MRVRCKIDNLNLISDVFVLERLKKYICLPDGDLDLSLGQEYTVYGIVFWDNSPWFYICLDEYDEYPTPFAADLFDVVNDDLPSQWKLCFNNNNNKEAATSLVFREWADDPFFYEKLLDGNIKEVQLFARYRKILDQA